MSSFKSELLPQYFHREIIYTFLSLLPDMCSPADGEPADNSNASRPTRDACRLALSDSEASQVQRHDPGVGGLNFCSLYRDNLLRGLIIKRP